jgi:hypothetical protein
LLRKLIMPSIGSLTALAAKADRQKYENHPDDKVDHGAVEHVTLPDSAFSDPGPKTFESGRIPCWIFRAMVINRRAFSPAPLPCRDVSEAATGLDGILKRW